MNDPDVDDIEIRDLRTTGDYESCVALQHETWGPGFREVVPATILKISQRVGGVSAGAFSTAHGGLLGFVFGLTGVEQGDIVHWSDMLAVRPDAQRLGIGRRLKRFQHDAVAALGARRMYWTYDPLIARNAAFNLVRLGARVAEYVPDMYGDSTGSPLHSGVGTDRLVVVWPIGAHAPEPGARAAADAPVLNGIELTTLHPLPSVARIAVPGDIFAIRAVSVERAAEWRRTTRRAFTLAFTAGYTVDGFEPGTGNAPGYYRLVRP